MATLLWPGLVAVIVCVPVLPTTVATETVLGVRLSTAGCGVGLEFAAVEEIPMQPDIATDAATRIERNARASPRFEREKFNVVFFLF